MLKKKGGGSDNIKNVIPKAVVLLGKCGAE